MFHRFEHLSKYVVTRDYTIGGLIDMNVRRMTTCDLGMAHTFSRIPLHASE